MALVLDGNGTMTVGNGDITGLVAGALPSTVIGAGAVLQVVSATQNAITVTTSTSFVTSGLSVSITPSSSTSKIMLFLTGGGFYNGGVSNSAYTTLYRGATNLGDATYGMERVYAGSTAFLCAHSISYLDSPSTTSATTYTAYFRSSSATSVNFTYNDSGVVVLTAMEISA